MSPGVEHTVAYGGGGVGGDMSPMEEHTVAYRGGGGEGEAGVRI